MADEYAIQRELIRMEESNYGPPRQADCCRCDKPTENPPVSCASVNGVNIDDCVLCCDCRVLSITDRKLFWNFGWKRFGGTRNA